MLIYCEHARTLGIITFGRADVRLKSLFNKLVLAERHMYVGLRRILLYRSTIQIFIAEKVSFH